MATIEYSIVKTHGEWRLEVHGDLRGISPSKEAAIGAANNAGRAAENLASKRRSLPASVGWAPRGHSGEDTPVMDRTYLTISTQLSEQSSETDWSTQLREPGLDDSICSART